MHAAVAGVPLLTASLVRENGVSKVQITLHSAGENEIEGYVVIVHLFAVCFDNVSMDLLVIVSQFILLHSSQPNSVKEI